MRKILNIDWLKPEVIAERKANNTAAFITFVPCGFKTKADTVDILLGLQRGGANIIEVGIPYSDPQADGPTIQRAHQVGVDQGITLHDVLATVSEARTKGLTTPVVLMGYYNNILQYGEVKICPDAQKAGVDGFIIVDLPPEEAKTLSDDAAKHGLAYIPLVSPTTTEERMKLIDSVAHGFVYCVSLTGVTGARNELPPNLDAFMAKIRANVKHPLALGFGLSTRQHFVQASALADGVVIGSKIVKIIEDAPDTATRAANVEAFAKSIVNP
ncbi:tryptophan synthase, putative [Phytophthora infestans T30-4]|uniref:tryptophan synthase n=1 Tax=Phytophthora infestans (strain T30-4) TaxID=403677 RepID=D0MQ90_PHYIT|nr:tryptophan synthase, putative [Phytophthora infestans T30-4]EEY57659.1 tryptophan synthase, putative [Phytophthora infestans T30-4]|eukprot:XP_002908845.1 tryptophan synthase, putative [Phytophthora infestans T30-4]